MVIPVTNGTMQVMTEGWDEATGRYGQHPRGGSARAMTHNLQETPAPEANGGPADGILRLIVEGLIARVAGIPLMGLPSYPGSAAPRSRSVWWLCCLPCPRCARGRGH